MSISIIGAGNMAKGLATRFAHAGHPVTLASRDQAKAEAAARDVGNGVSSAPLASAAQSADIVVLAVPFDAAGDVIEAAGGFAGKIVVDITNPMKADFSGLSIGHTTSAAEEIQKRAPQPVAALNITLGYGLGHGTDIAPTWQRAA